MKTLLLSVALFGACVMSCKKNNNNSPNLLLLQHKWMVISENGEALRYAGMPSDYWNFATDSKLYTYVNQVYDTSVYSLHSDGQTLSLYQITNGARSNTAVDFTLRSLNDTQLILSHSSGIISSLDSLKR